MTSSLNLLFVFLSLSAPNPSSDRNIVVSVQSLKWIVQELYPLDKIEVICPPGNSPHTFELKPQDLKLAANARFGLSISDEYDPWFQKLNIGRQANMLSLLPKSARQKPQFEHHHDHDSGPHLHLTVDPHFWMDPLTVEALVDPLVKKFCEWEPTDCPSLERRANSFKSRLQGVHAELKTLMSPVKGKAFLSSHDGFGYFVRRYELDYLEPIEPMPGKEPSPKDIKRMIELARTKSVLSIFGEIQLPLAPVQALAAATRPRVVVLDQYGASENIQNYFDLIRDNAQKIKAGLELEKGTLAP